MYRAKAVTASAALYIYCWSACQFNVFPLHHQLCSEIKHYTSSTNSNYYCTAEVWRNPKYDDSAISGFLVYCDINPWTLESKVLSGLSFSEVKYLNEVFPSNRWQNVISTFIELICSWRKLPIERHKIINHSSTDIFNLKSSHSNGCHGRNWSKRYI